MARALIIVDIQNDFCPGGALAVAEGAETAAAVSEFLQVRGAAYAAVVATQDWHVDPGAHFSANPDFRTTWPVHCRADTPGAAFHEDLDTDAVEAVFRKGLHDAGYSGFDGLLAPEDEVATGEHDPGTERVWTEDVSLDDWLREAEIDAVDVVGIATDFCVRATVLDAVDAGYETRVLEDLCAGVDPEGAEQALAEMAEAGAEVIDSAAVGR